MPPQDKEEFKKLCALLEGNDAIKFHKQIHEAWDREWECMPTLDVMSERDNIKKQWLLQNYFVMMRQFVENNV